MELKQQPFRWFKGEGSALTQTVLKLEQAASRSPWQAGELAQAPNSLRAHGMNLKEYRMGML